MRNSCLDNSAIGLSNFPLCMNCDARHVHDSAHMISYPLLRLETPGLFLSLGATYENDFKFGYKMPPRYRFRASAARFST
jgi:hypothetical protein